MPTPARSSLGRVSPTRSKLRDALKSWDELELPPPPETPREVSDLQRRAFRAETELTEARARHSREIEAAGVLAEQAEARAAQLQAEKQVLEERVAAMRLEMEEAELAAAGARDTIAKLRHETEDCVGHASGAVGTSVALEQRVAVLEREAEEAAAKHAAELATARGGAERESKHIECDAAEEHTREYPGWKLVQEKCVANAEWLIQCRALRDRLQRAFRFHSRAIVSLHHSKWAQTQLSCLLVWAQQASRHASGHHPSTRALNHSRISLTPSRSHTPSRRPESPKRWVPPGNVPTPAYRTQQ